MTTRKSRRAHPQESGVVAPPVKLVVDEREFLLAFDFGALSIAKQKLKDAGIQINLLHALDFTKIDVDVLPMLFYAGACRHQPDLAWNEVPKYVRTDTLLEIYIGLLAAWKLAMAKPDPNPSEAPAKS